jgi:molybdopterin converting factor small subunit
MPAAAVSAVAVRVLLFASYAENLGADTMDLMLPSPAKVRDVVGYLRGLPGGHLLPSKPLCARNLAHAGQEDLVTDGDEIAILPPVAGG